MKKNLQILFLFVLGLFMFSQNVLAQGVTTANISGIVLDETGEPLIGANVLAVHQPSGTRYGTSTRIDGRFNFPNVRVGGPYIIEVSYVGYNNQKQENIFLSLGETRNITFKVEGGVTLGEVVISTKRDDIFDTGKTGASTNVGKELVQSLPTISRGFNDFTRMTPQADIKGGGISIGGMNNRFNQVTIDGAVSNDVFGLSASGTNGGQTGTSPISLDAIEEFSVQIAPYDVRLGGFAGGGINAITRSGTNDIQGSVYHFTRNEKLAGLTPTNNPEQERKRYDNFSDRQTGFRVGGPIVKNKAFFFLNGEITDNNTPLSFRPGTPDSEITEAEVLRVESRLKALGYDPGDWRDLARTESSVKLFGRIDINLNNNHKLTVRHSYTKGESQSAFRNQRNLEFSNGGILRQSPTHSSVIELNSRFGNKASNNLIAGFTSIREPRSSAGDPFPRGTINIGTNRNITFGSEPFSTVNQLNQDIFTLTNNFSLYKGKHTLTLGTHNEFYSIYNAFIGENFGTYQFSSLENFEAGLASRFSHQYSITDDPKEGAKFKAMQLGFYVQDDIDVSSKLKVTAGLRLDVPIYLDSPRENSDFNASELARKYGVNNTQLPKPALMFSPRVGFNYDVKGDKTTQLRGGTGIFTSRFPFVWMGGAFTQSGVLLNTYQIGTNNGAANIPFNSDPFGQPRNPNVQGPGGRMTVVDPNFRLPQVFRTNLAIDKKLPFGFIGTLEGMFAKTLNNFRFTQINQIESTGNLIGADKRAIWPNVNNDKKILRNYDEVIYINNTNEGHSYSGTAQLQRPFENGLYFSAAYTYTRSFDVFPGTSSQNHSNWRPLPNVNGVNNATLTNSPFDTRSRIVAVASYRKEFIKTMASTVSLFYTGQSGAAFSYVYNGDLNREDVSGGQNTDLIYIPRKFGTYAEALAAGEIMFLNNYNRGTATAPNIVSDAQQWAEFESFIESQPYLRDRRGQYAERNGARSPFTHQFDFKFVQDIFTNVLGKKNTIQFTVDIFNVGNLLNKNWGRQYTYGNGFFDNTFQVLRLRNQANLQTQQPVFTFDPVVENSPWNISDSPIGGSRWVGQIGFRYIFN
jgi:hypothetical protein